jgi:hypothetical protein
MEDRGSLIFNDVPGNLRLIGYVVLFQIGNCLAERKQHAIRVDFFPLDVAVNPIIGEKHSAHVTCLDEFRDAVRPFLPGQCRTARHSPERMVHAERVSAPGEADEVIYIVSVVAVTERYSGGVLRPQLRGLRLAFHRRAGARGYVFQWQFL